MFISLPLRDVSQCFLQYLHANDSLRLQIGYDRLFPVHYLRIMCVDLMSSDGTVSIVDQSVI
jgi:hypothetical protein